MRLEQQLASVALERGATGFGICAVEPFTDVRRDLEARVRDGSHAELTFTYNDPARSTDVSRSFPWAHRLAVVGWPYVPRAGSPGPPESGSGRIARFATEDFYIGLRNVLGELAEILSAAGHRAETLADDNRLVDRAAAVRAGVGWWGKSTMVLAPRAGPWLLIGSVVTDADLSVSEPMKRDCGTCTACIPACPTGALVAPGVLDARRCLARWAQAGGVIPREYRALMGDRLYGCDDCLDACPPGQRLLSEAVAPRGRVDLVALLDASDEELLRDFGHFYLPRRRPAILRRNALVALGNGGGPEHVPVVGSYLTDPDWVLRLHAAWALGALGGSVAHRELKVAAAHEGDARVLDEIEAALR